MKVDFNNQTKYNNSKPSFGAINAEAAEDTLRKVLTSKELVDFKRMIAQYAKEDLVDAIFFGEGKKLTAKVVDTTQLKEGFREKYRSPWPFERKMHFIKRVVQEMKDRSPKVKELLAKQNFEF